MLPIFAFICGVGLNLNNVLSVHPSVTKPQVESVIYIAHPQGTYNHTVRCHVKTVTDELNRAMQYHLDTVSDRFHQ